MLQSGRIASAAMVKALVGLVILALGVGTALILTGLGPSERSAMVFYFLLGIAAIAAAVKYTIGKNPYGYRGLGDVFVFLFFGLTGALGTYYLHTHHMRYDILLPAASIGLLSTGVLNLNNMRDIESDTLSAKRTLAFGVGLLFG